MIDKRSRKGTWLVIFALVTLFNPNINLIDPLPDFIGYFILCRVFLRAADAAPYFDEARRAIMRLAYVNIGKIFGLIVIGITRSGNTASYDIYALVTLVFSAAEIICLIPAVKNTFAALDYLGERTDAVSLISDKRGKLGLTLPTLTYVFTVTKAALAFLPEMLRLTRNVESKEALRLVKLYAPALVLSVIVVLVLGIIWLIRTLKFTKGVIKEGLFQSSLEILASAGSYSEFEKKLAIRKIGRAFICFTLAAIFSVDLIFDNFNSVNLFPDFLFGIFMLLGISGILEKDMTSRVVRVLATALPIAHVILSLASFFLEVNFLDNFEYADLLNFSNPEALSAFIPYVTVSSVSTLIHLGISVLLFVSMKQLTDSHLGLKDECGELVTKSAEIRAINKKTVVFATLSALCGAFNLLRVILSGIVKVIYFKSVGGGVSSMIVSVFPSVGLFANAIAILYIIYTIYYLNTVKDEIA